MLESTSSPSGHGRALIVFVMCLTDRRSASRAVSFAALAAAALPLTALYAAPMHGAVPPSLQQIVSSLETTEQRKQNDLQSYSSVRRYVLKNDRFKQDAEMIVRMDY